MKPFLPMVTLLVCGSAGAADYCEYRKSLDFSLSAADLVAIDVTAGAGNLKIVGDRATSEVQVVATACASSQKLLDSLDLTQRQTSDTLVLEARTENSGWSWGSKNSYANINLEIAVPERFAVAVNDGSGPVVIRGVASAMVEDGSGELELDLIGGDVTIEDGSGDIRVTDVAGRVYLSDGSGAIEIRGVGQDVFIEEDGSGEIDIRDVTLNVVIEEDGSGGIDVRQVGGDVRIDEDASGGIRVSDVTGSLTVDRDSNGGIRHSNVAGAVSIPEDRKKRY